MRKLIAINNVSLDGVMQAPGGPEEDPTGRFELGGWSVPYWDPKLAEWLHQTVSGAFDLLLGHRTYDVFAGYWPGAGDNPVTQGFNRATKYVATRGKPQFDWEKSVALEGDAVTAVRQLKEGTGPEIQIYGSHNFLQQLIKADLVDEYLMWTYPVVLGRGKRLFEEGAPPRALRLLEAERSPTGVTVTRYVPEGPAEGNSPGAWPPQ